MVDLVIMTGNIRFYYEITQVLTRNGFTFDSMLPSAELHTIPRLVMSTASEEALILDAHRSLTHNVLITFRSPFLQQEIEDRVTRRIIQLQAGEWQRLIIGVDPGKVFGVVALINNMIVQRQQAHSPHQATAIVKELLDRLGTQENILRIGEGAPLMTQQFLKMILPLLSQSLRIEMVNEFGTNRAKRDVKDGFKFVDLAAAAKIARTPGKQRQSLGTLRVPSKGEKRWMQQLSRKQSTGRITISETAAQRVLQGELSLTQAIEELLPTPGLKPQEGKIDPKDPT